MALEIGFSAHAWRKQSSDARMGETQEVWRELPHEPGAWLHAVLVRLPSGVFVERASIRRDLQPNGVWRSSNPVANPQAMIAPVEDAAARTVRPTPPKPADHAGARYIKSQNYAIPGRETE
jgi:hypothetical protein